MKNTVLPPWWDLFKVGCRTLEIWKGAGKFVAAFNMTSYWTKRRRIQEESNKFLQMIEQDLTSEQQSNKEDNVLQNLDVEIVEDLDVSYNFMPSHLHQDHILPTEVNSSNSNSNSSTDLKSDLCLWSIRHNITHDALSDILKILKPHVINSTILPICSKTLLKTPRQILVTRIPGGKFYYFGITDRIIGMYQKFQSTILNICSLSLTIGCDGFPICKSSNTQMWPILCKVNEILGSRPFIAGLFCGETKPACLKDFLNKFVLEMKFLLANGILLGTKFVNISIKCIIADAPARSFLKGIKGHSGHHACERCDDEGEWDGRVCYSTKPCNLRTDKGFREKIDNDHHLIDSPLLELELGMVSQFVLDYMHLLCLGIMKKLLHIWLDGPLKNRLPAKKAKQISEYLQLISGQFPREFARRPRALDQLRRYKATEFRQFLLYSGPCALRGILPESQYKHFLLLHAAAHILLSNNANNLEWNGVAKKLIQEFVKTMSNLYGSTSIVYNVHSLLHLPDDALRFGSLDNISAFEFENYLQFLKRLLRGKHLPIEQIVKRVIEYEKFDYDDTNNSKVNSSKIDKEGHYKKFSLGTFYVSNKKGDNCFITRTRSIVLVERIFDGNGTVFVECKKIKEYENIKFYPIPSSNLKIYKFKLEFDAIDIINVTDLVKKCVLIPYKLNCRKNLYCSVPMLI